MNYPDVTVRVKPKRVTGVAHLIAAARYSSGGIRRLWQETAFQHILISFPACILLLFVCDASLMEYAFFLILSLALVAGESLNTAIECLVDHLADDWQEFARDAKDLGSLATMCLLIANGVFLASVVVRAIF